MLNRNPSRQLPNVEAIRGKVTTQKVGDQVNLGGQSKQGAEEGGKQNAKESDKQPRKTRRTQARQSFLAREVVYFGIPPSPAVPCVEYCR